MKNRNSVFDHGQSLIEVVVAVGIIVIVLVGVADLISRSLSATSFQAKQKMAQNIAQNQLTSYRQERDQNQADFFIDTQSKYGVCVGDFDIEKFQCVITYLYTYDGLGSINGVNMNVVVNWSDGDKQISTTLTQLLAKPTR
jgi:Tfp pilus assembly protein PilV